MWFAPAGTCCSREEMGGLGVWFRYDRRRDMTASLSGAGMFHPSRGTVRPGLIVSMVRPARLRDQTNTRGQGRIGGQNATRPYATSRIETWSNSKGD